MKKFIIITSIFKPTEAVRKFAKFKDWHLVVVGDKKTPSDWKLTNATYLSPEDQTKLGYNILKVLPWNHYCRKMVGYLYAISQGADVIYDTDDDNIPLSNWFEPKFKGSFKEISGSKFINVYSQFTKRKIWPRGLPLKEILAKNKSKTRVGNFEINIWQFLADGDPDVDAIYRLTDNTHIKFAKKAPFVLAKNCISPINSQNTFFHKDAFCLLYLPAFVTFRFTDILRGLIAQPILASMNRHIGFGTATVFQKRNEHDYLKDFESEIPVYLHSEATVDIAEKQASSHKKTPDMLRDIYTELHKKNIVTSKELELLELWINDVSTLTSAQKILVPNKS